MHIYMTEVKKDIMAFKKAIKLCKDDKNLVEILKKYQTRIEEEFSYADFLRKDFIPLIQNKEDFFRAYIYLINGGDYRVDVFIVDANECSKKAYIDICNRFCKEEETFFFFHVYDTIKDKDEYIMGKDYDRITILPKRKKVGNPA